MPSGRRVSAKRSRVSLLARTRLFPRPGSGRLAIAPVALPRLHLCLRLLAAILRERAALIVAFLAFGTAADIAFVAARRDQLTFRRRSPFRNSFHVVFPLG